MTAPRLSDRDYFVLIKTNSKSDHDPRFARRDMERVIGGGGYKNLLAQLLQSDAGFPTRPFTIVRARPLGRIVEDPETGVALAAEWRLSDGGRNLSLGAFLGPHGAGVLNLLTRLARPFAVAGITREQRRDQFRDAFDSLAGGLPGASRQDRLANLRNGLSREIKAAGLENEAEAACAVALRSAPLNSLMSEPAADLVRAMIEWSVLHGAVRSPFASLIELIRAGATLEIEGDHLTLIDFEAARLAALRRQVEEAFASSPPVNARPVSDPAVTGHTIAAWCGQDSAGASADPFSSTAVVGYDSSSNTFAIACEDAGVLVSITYADMHAALHARPVERAEYRLGEHMNSSAPSGYLLSIDQGHAVVFLDSDALAEAVSSYGPRPPSAGVDLG